MYDVIKCIFILFSLSKVMQYVNYRYLLFWKCAFGYY